MRDRRNYENSAVTFKFFYLKYLSQLLILITSITKTYKSNKEKPILNVSILGLFFIVEPHFEITLDTYPENICW